MKIIILILTLFSLSCSTSKKFEDNINTENCDDALKESPQNNKDFRFVSETQEAAGNVFSYTAAGAGYTADILITVSTNMVVGIAVCSPLRRALNGEGNFPGECVRDLHIPISTKLGPAAFEATEPLRCPRVDTISQAIRRVAQCFVKKGDSESYNKALQSLTATSQSKNFYRCLSAKERNAFEQDLEKIKGLNQAVTGTN